MGNQTYVLRRRPHFKVTVNNYTEYNPGYDSTKYVFYDKSFWLLLSIYYINYSKKQTKQKHAMQWRNETEFEI